MSLSTIRVTIENYLRYLLVQGKNVNQIVMQDFFIVIEEKLSRYLFIFISEWYTYNIFQIHTDFNFTYAL